MSRNVGGNVTGCECKGREGARGCIGVSPVVVREMEGVRARGVCEGRPRGVRRPVRDVRTASGQEVCRVDRREAGGC